MHLTQTTYTRTLALLGVLVALMPIIHFPRFWDDVFLMASGLLIVLISFTLREKKLHSDAASVSSNSPANPGFPKETV
jgi:hypothetical protein